MFYECSRKSPSGTYDVILTFSDIEVCKSVAGMNSIPVYQRLFEIIQSTDGNILDACTNSGDIKMANLTFENSSFVSMFPDGEYKTTYRFFDEVDANIYNVSYYVVR